MTKRQLIATLEPFEDDIPIILLDVGNYKEEPRIFYYMNSDGYGDIIISGKQDPQGKAVELRIK